jgi:hypothetical protein
MDPKRAAQLKFKIQSLEGIKKAMAPKYADELQADQDTLVKGDMNAAGFGGMEDQLLPVSKSLELKKKLAQEAAARARLAMGKDLGNGI